MSALPNRKQLIALSQLILVVWVAAFFFRMRSVESAVARKEFLSLVALNSLSRLPIHQDFVSRGESDAYAIRAHLKIQKPLTDWLKAENPDIDKAHITARQQVVDWLITQGVPESVIKDATGKGHGESLPFLFFQTTLPLPESQFFGEADIDLDAPVGLLLDETSYWGQASSIRIVTAVDVSQFPDLKIKHVKSVGSFDPTRTPQFAPKAIPLPVVDDDEPANPKELRPDKAIDLPIDPVAPTRPEVTEEDTRYVLKEVRLLEKDEVALTFRADVQDASQDLGNVKSFRIPVKTTIVNKPWIDLLGSKLQSDALGELEKKGSLRSKLNNTYGRIRTKQALDITSRRMLDTYGNVKLLGFDFNPTSFWMFVGAFFVIFLGAIGIQLRYPYGEQKDESTMFGLHLFLDLLAVRVVLWIFVPLTALLLVMPVQDTASPESAGYWGLLILVCVGGCLLTAFSVKIGRKGKDEMNNDGTKRVVDNA